MTTRSQQRRKVCVVVTARASYARIRTALTAIRAHPDLELQLVLAGSVLLDRYGLAARTIDKDGFPVAARVHMVLEGENLLTSAKSTGIGLSEMATVFDNLQPDVVITIADRYETIATAIAASYMNIPLVHVQGGEVSGSIDDRVRHAVTKLSNYHFVCSAQAQARVISMGEDPKSVFNTGCPSIDIAAEIALERGARFDPFQKYTGVGAELDLSNGYIVVLEHPVTTEYEHARSQFEATLKAVHRSSMPALWFWPNVDAGSDGASKAIRAYRENDSPENMYFFKNMQPEDFLRLLIGAKCLVGNSSVGIRECSYLGVPAVNIGARQRGRERGRNVVDVDHRADKILDALQQQARVGRYECDPIYGDGTAGTRIADLVSRIELVHDKASI